MQKKKTKPKKKASKGKEYKGWAVMENGIIQRETVDGCDTKSPTYLIAKSKKQCKELVWFEDEYVVPVKITIL